MGTIVEALDVNQAAAHGADWRALAARAIEPNAFYEPAVALAALKHLNPDARVLMVRDGRKLIGVWPVKWHRARFLAPLSLMVAEPSYAPITTPLLDKDTADAAAKALFGWLREQNVTAFHVPKISSEGAAAKVLLKAIAELGGTYDAINPHERAALTQKSDAEIPSKTRRENERLRRRLEEQGKLALTVATTPNDVAAALKEFLKLEQSGWKARSGNPMAGNAGDLGFITEAASALAQQGAMRVILLRAGEKPVAAGLVMTSGNRAFYFKTAYDEALAKFAPGVLITQDITDLLLNGEKIAFTDSLADPGHPLMDRMWQGRLPIADWMIAPNGDSALFRMIVCLEKLRQSARAKARKLLRR